MDKHPGVSIYAGMSTNPAGSVCAMPDAPVHPLPTSVEGMNKVSPKLMWPQLVNNAIWMVIVCGGLYLCYR